MSARISVVLSQGQSQNPTKRDLEEGIVTALMLEPDIDVTVVPHLYDLAPESTGLLALSGIGGNMIVVSWLYERAARWILDRHGIRGQLGATTLATEMPEDDDAMDDDAMDAADLEDPALEDHNEPRADEKSRVADQREAPHRRIYCIELGVSHKIDDFVTEVRRIATENSQKVVGLSQWIQGNPASESLQRYHQPTNNTARNLGSTGASGNGASGNGAGGNGAEHQTDAPFQSASPSASVQRIEEQAARRWYPVIDFSRCTNCMECIDFCLFGVYGADAAETILVEQPDNCRKGCPACSRVCPENAIIFPQHKTPSIAGAPAPDTGGFKIDLSKLFGAPDALQTAAAERDEQLMLVGREAVGMNEAIPKRQAEPSSVPRDALDNLIDQLDELDL
jgi:NAD-dependent dihydropyrimidine dehydrogenase PreA subunit